MKEGEKNAGSVHDVETSSTKGKKIAAKVLKYFPLIPRLKRLFFSQRKTTSDMRWHEEHCKKDGKLRHPAYGEAFKAFNTRFPDFASDARNVRLALSNDGLKGRRNNIDTYLQPLIEELKLLWEGVNTYDGCSKQYFNMRGALIWTINDFPA
ncbi:hypothetical protein M5689_010888 [Euphorbia peplus]|nr:hypothetical protein M5689_010888 [Euphorbia peplus]